MIESSADCVAVDATGLHHDLDLLGTTEALAFADADVVEPGGEARFSTGSFAVAGEVDHFEFSVSGRPG